jgi:cell division protein ZapA
MAQVTVTIDGKSYRMACDDGQEAHLEGLAAYFEGRVQEMRTSFGEIGDMRLTIMAAITASDEIFELRKKLATSEGELVEARRSIDGFGLMQTENERKTAETITAIAERVERISKGLVIN